MEPDPNTTASDRVPLIPPHWSPQERNRWASQWMTAQAKLQRLEAERIAALANEPAAQETGR